MTEKHKHVLQLRLTVINFASHLLIRKLSHSSHFSRIFNRRHLVPRFYSSYEPTFIKHMITSFDCFVYETMFWQCSAEDYVKSCFKAILLIIAHKVGGFVSVDGKK